MKNKIQYTDHGRIPPQAVDMEEAVLGAILIEKHALEKVIDFITPEMFYKDAHQKIYEGVLSLYSEQQPVDLLTVVQKLKAQGALDSVGGAYYLSTLSNRVASALNIETHSKYIAQKYMQRQLITVCTEASQIAYHDDADIFDLITTTETQLNHIIEARTRKDARQIDQLLREYIKDLTEKEKRRNEGLAIGIPSGFHKIDHITGGFHPGELTIIAARPGMGKSAFAASMARNVAIQFGIPVAIFSLEMPASQNVARLVAMETHVELHRLRDAKLNPMDWQKIMNLTTNLIKSKIFIDDTPAISLLEMRAKCRRLRSKEKIQMVIIDYLQLMHGERSYGSNREQEIGNISRGLKAMAKELEIPVVALSQLSRAVETRGGTKKPQLSDLRESGSIEQDADNVVFLYRPDYYGITQDEFGNDQTGKVEYIIEKHRNGELATTILQFNKVYTEFKNDNVEMAF